MARAQKPDSNADREEQKPPRQRSMQIVGIIQPKPVQRMPQRRARIPPQGRRVPRNPPPSSPGIKVTFLWGVSCLLLMPFGYALSAHNSPWKPASWRLVINVGRESSSTMPADWGRSGARLSFPVELRIESDRLPDEEQDPLLGRGANRLRVLQGETKRTYITSQGEQQVPLKATGGWKLRLAGKPGHASLLRFWLDIGPTLDDNAGASKNVAAQKNDVTLQAQERLYFAAHCWRQSEWELGRRKLRPILEAYERAQAKLEDTVSHEAGDRRLDGTDALETLAAYKDMAGLTLDRDNKRRQFLDAQEYLPPPDNLQLGNWPGSTELVAIQPMELFVQRKQGLLGTQEYHLLGSWTAKPLNVVAEDNDDQYEYIEEEDDDEDGEEVDVNGSHDEDEEMETTKEIKKAEDPGNKSFVGGCD